MRPVLQIPCGVSNAFLRLETGMAKVETRVCLASINLWLKLNFYLQGLASLILQVSFQSTWIKSVESKFKHLSSLVLNMKYGQTNQTKGKRYGVQPFCRQHTTDILSLLRTTCTARSTHHWKDFSLARSWLSPLQYRMANIKKEHWQKDSAPVILERRKPQNMFIFVAPFTQTHKPDLSSMLLIDELPFITVCVCGWLAFAQQQELDGPSSH